MKGIALKIALTETGGVQEILELNETELVQVLRKREGIAIEKSADQMDQVQYASERDLAIRNVDRESRLLLQVRAALQRIRDGSSEHALSAILRSAQNVSPLCHGRRVASSARRLPTGMDGRERTW
jgi:hypothetical protein